jgi:hypothetical protein
MPRDLLIRWLPTLCIILFVVVALSIAVSMRASARRKSVWLAVVLLTGSLAVAATVWQQRDIRQQAKSFDRLAQATGLAGSPVPKPKVLVSRAAAEIRTLSRETEALRSKIANLERREKGRVIDEATAGKLVADLEQAGARTVVVSCVWGDDEAYDYANQIVDILRRAGWQASGPEPTVIFGNAPSMSVGIYVPEEAAAGTAKILMDAFTKFAIPFETRVPPSGALPGGSPVELFVSRKPQSTAGEGSTTQ